MVIGIASLETPDFALGIPKSILLKAFQAFIIGSRVEVDRPAFQAADNVYLARFRPCGLNGLRDSTRRRTRCDPGETQRGQTAGMEPIMTCVTTAPGSL
jgi:hypothetical protein